VRRYPVKDPRKLRSGCSLSREGKAEKHNSMVSPLRIQTQLPETVLCPIAPNYEDYFQTTAVEDPKCVS
jgi:hypothetical protein